MRVAAICESLVVTGAPMPRTRKTSEAVRTFLHGCRAVERPARGLFRLRVPRSREELAEAHEQRPLMGYEREPELWRCLGEGCAMKRAII
jgi:hypothetical protein